MYLLESPRRGDSNKYTKRMIHKKICSKVLWSKVAFRFTNGGAVVINKGINNSSTPEGILRSNFKLRLIIARTALKQNGLKR